MNIKAKKAKVQALSKKSVINVLSQDEIKKKVQVIEQELKASTWRELKQKANLRRMTNSLSSLKRCLSLDAI